MTRAEAKRVIAVMLAACPATKLDADRVETMVAVWAERLADLSYADVNAALGAHLDKSPFMPAVADIRRTVVQMRRGPVRSGGDAWGSVLRAIREQGAYRMPGFDFRFADPLVAQCVAALGWQNLCLSENQVADRARFIQMYDEFAGHARDVAISPTLAAADEKRKQLERAGAPVTIGNLLSASSDGDER